MEENDRRERLIQKEMMSQPIEHVREEIVALLPRLRRFARTLARSPHDADDLVQIAIERALARFEQLRSDSSIAAWMFGIVRNAWIDEVRAHAGGVSAYSPQRKPARTSATRAPICKWKYCRYKQPWRACRRISASRLPRAHRRPLL